MENSTSDFLNRSPLFKLSLSSKELFHSNFISWLCDNYGDLMSKIFSKFLDSNDESIKIINRVQREKKKIDLTISFDNTETLYIENKVKSLPNEEQLRKYLKKIRKLDPRSSFLLLSIHKPDFDLGEWNYLSYNDFAKELEEIINNINNDYHKLLILDYITFIRYLSELSINIKIDLNNNLNFSETGKIFEDLGLNDLYIKIIYEKLSELLLKEVKLLNSFNDIPIKRNCKRNVVERKDTELIINDGMTNGKGLMYIYYFNKSNYGLIVGLDKMSYIKGVVSNKDSNEKIVKSTFDNFDRNNKWFNFDQLKNFIIPYQKKVRNMKSYGRDFKYKSVKLNPEISIRKLLEILVNDIKTMKKILQ